MDNNLETYLAWKSNLEMVGKTPQEMVAQFRNNGMTEYADNLNSFILKMEASRSNQA